MRLWLTIACLLTAAHAFADVSVTASVDRNRVALGETVAFTIAIQGAQQSSPPAIPRADGLTFAGPAMNQNMSWVNGKVSQSISLVYQVTPTRTGELTIPSLAVTVAGKTYQTEPIRLVVDKGAVPPDLNQQVFIRAQMPSQQVYLGQTMPLDVRVYARADVPLAGFNGYTSEADGLGYRYLPNLKSGTQTINGEAFKVFVIEGAITPGRTGSLTFGPCVVQGQLAVQARRTRDSIFDQFFGRQEVRPLPLSLDPVPIEVLPLPDTGRPADFSGAIGQWNLAVTAKPTAVAVGDPITLTIKISGAGNIDLVSTPKLTGLEEFKTYDPTVKTTKNELNTTGERVIQQVLIARSTTVKQLPEVRLSYFDPVAKAYKTAVQPAIPLVVQANPGERSTIVSGGTRIRPEEKLGQDIVYLKGDLGPAAPATPRCATTLFWVLNLAPVVALLAGLGWQRRADKLRGDVAYARRSRAARTARKLLEAAGGCDAVQQALQSYLGDRLNIPAAGITASVVEERRLPARVREIFEACDAARFAGAQTDLAALKQSVEQVIDELENTNR